MELASPHGQIVILCGAASCNGPFNNSRRAERVGVGRIPKTTGRQSLLIIVVLVVVVVLVANVNTAVIAMLSKFNRRVVLHTVRCV
jgi:hypothetical protein